MENRTVDYFGYGLMRNRDYLGEVVGSPGLSRSVGVYVDGFSLAFQGLDFIPPEPRGVLREIWGEEFCAYTLREGVGKVSGLIWAITPGQVERLGRWEFIGTWRKWVDVVVTDSHGGRIKAVTDVAMEDEFVSGTVDGLNYREENLFGRRRLGRMGKEKEEVERKLQTLREKVELLTKEHPGHPDEPAAGFQVKRPRIGQIREK